MKDELRTWKIQVKKKIEEKGQKLPEIKTKFEEK